MTEREILEILSTESAEFKKLGDEHKNLEKLLSGFNGKVYLTHEEEVEKKQVQKLKLQKKDRMAELVRQYKKAHPLN